MSDTRDLRHRYRLAISDPGTFVPREPDETVPNWSVRAVLAVRDEELERLAQIAHDTGALMHDWIDRAEAAERKLLEIEREVMVAREMQYRLRARLAETTEIMRDLVDDDPCQHDHHGHCQTHGWLSEGECPHARARRIPGDAGDSDVRP